MKVLIIGATGTIGRQLVSQALEKGHRVTAFARDPSKVTLNHANLNVIEGDVMDPLTFEGVFSGQDAIICALGAGSKGGVRSTGTRNIIQAMRASGVQRLVCLSSLGVGDSRGNLNFFWKHIMFGLLLRRAFADHVAQEQYIKESGLEWTIARPGAFTDGDMTREYRHGFSATAPGLKIKISRADVAHFMLNQLEDDKYMAMTPGISY